MVHFTDTWKSNDGVEIFAQGWEPDMIKPKAVVCLVHGIGEHSARYAHVAAAFVKESFVLFGFDHRGHGRSDGPRGHMPSIEAVMIDIDLLIENSLKRYPGLPIILYGHSLGGILVLYYGLTRKPDVKGIIATSSGLKTVIENQPLKIYAARIFGSIIPKVAISSGLDVNAISRNAQVVQDYKADPLVHDKVTLGAGKIILSASRWVLQHAGEMTIPLLLLHGKADAIAFASGSIEVAEKLPGKCTLVLYEGAYHELHNEPEQNEVFRTMIDWMEHRMKG
jgi:alpha-beta hydrolase superfamily lysophospholipase